MLLILLGSLGVVAIVDTSLSSIITQTGELSVTALPLESTESDADLLNDITMRQVGGCAPLVFDSFTGLWDNASTTGAGLAFNTTGPAALLDCPVSTRVYNVIMHTEFSGQDVLDLGTHAVGFGMRIGNLSKENQTIQYSLGLVNPFALPWITPTICGSCSGTTGDYIVGTEKIVPLDSDLVAFMQLSPTFLLAVTFQTTDDEPFVPDLAEPMAIDLTLYGPSMTEEVAFIGDFSEASLAITRMFGPEVILMTTYYFVAMFSFLSAVLIWRTSTFKTFKRNKEGKK